MRRAPMGAALVAAAALLNGGCNAILGMDEGAPLPPGAGPAAGGSGSGGSGSGGSGGAGAAGGAGGSTGSSGPPSCAGLPDTCGAEGTFDCCETVLVSGFHFDMGRSDSGSDAFPGGQAWEQPEHNAEVSSFFLDVFEVSVGRFRAFLDQYDGAPPASGAGEHPLIPGSGWQPAWDAELLARDALLMQLHCHPFATWTDDLGPNEQLPMTCANWYEMFLFCLWDGGRLPTEAEWEYAAAGGLGNRLYPWGGDPPVLGLVVFDCAWGGTPGVCEAGDIAPVGSAPMGASANGIRDLAGSMWEFTLDRYSDVWYAQTGNTCVDCANLTEPTTMGHTVRGGAFNAPAADLRAARRDSIVPTWRAEYLGWRCARSP